MNLQKVANTKSKSRSEISFEELNAGLHPEEVSDWDRFSQEFEGLESFSKLRNLKLLKLKKMFGGLAIYRGQKLCLLLCKNELDFEWIEKRYKDPIWHGLLLATDYKYQASLVEDLPKLKQHPVLKKWLFLPRKSRGWASIAKKVESLIIEKDSRVGIRSPKKKKQAKKNKRSRKT